MNIIIKLIYFKQTCLVHVIKKVANPEIKSKAFNPEKNIKKQNYENKRIHKCPINRTEFLPQTQISNSYISPT